jgi:malto-oligosyltrehalose synthase
VTSQVVPRATYRLQFNKGFTFADAEALVPYLARLGVSHIYASPIMAARGGSMHGYDVVDPTRINPELGGEEGLKRLCATARRHDIGLIVDIVPNHMAATLENAWWADVLRRGRSSRYARFFDIDWDCEDAELRGKVFLPWLSKPRVDAERSGDIEQLGLPKPGAYLLAWWRTANDRINWRRFFDINDLVCLRMEDDEAFEAVHATVARLYAEGVIDGVRVDHIDGLTDPRDYCGKLRQRLDPHDPERPYLIVEKILLHGERLPADWGCDGTTGYDFMDEVSALQHAPSAENLLARAWADLSGRSASFADEEVAARRDVIRRSFSAALEACVAAFDVRARSDPAGRDLSRPALRRAVTELLANYPVYRSYGAAPSPFLDEAAAHARRTGLPSDGWVIDILHRWMSDGAPDRAVSRLQQLSAPIAAKAVEDTAFYRYGRLLSRNDVGFDVEHFGLPVDEFHARMQRRQADFPQAMLATATHDHKRGEDVRARLAVLSERPEPWIARCRDWLARCAPLRTSGRPSNGDIAMLLQMIVGAWPPDLALEDDAGRRQFAERLAGWQQKALREAKLHTDWTDPNEAYEAAARGLLIKLLAENRAPDLLAAIHALVEEIAPAGMRNSLAQVLLKLTVPGVPDIYQGCEGWDFSLVDPDNRRPVDYTCLQRMDNPKQALIVRALAVRKALPGLFAEGSYEPIDAPEQIVAFVRRHGNDAAVVMVPRLGGIVGDVALRLPSKLTLFDALGGGATIDGEELSLPGQTVALFSTFKPR